MVLPSFDDNNNPLFAILSFYANRDINGDFKRKPHIMLSIHGREYLDERSGLVKTIQKAIAEKRIVDFDWKKIREDMPVIAQQTRLGNVTQSSLKQSLSQFQKEIKAFREKNNIHYQERDFLYDELVAKGDLTGVVVDKSVQVKLNNGIIDNAWVVKEVKKKCQTVSNNGGKTYYVDAPDIGRNVEVINDGITHGFARPNDRRNGKSTPKAIINARVSLVIPELLKNSIEANRSRRGNSPAVPYTHVMIGTVGLEDNNGNVDYYAVRSMIQERANQDPILVDVNVLGRLTSVNAKKIDSPNVQVNKNVDSLAHGRAYGYNIADFLNDVKDVFDNTFSEDVYRHFGMDRTDDDFSKNLLFQERESGHSNRTLLANALSSVAQSAEEKQRLNEYKSKIRLIEGEQKKLGIKKKSCNH